MNAPDDDHMILHTEELHVTTMTVPVQTVRIEKVIVTERRTITADVRREELRITREPAPDLTAPGTEATPPPAPLVIILREEQLVVTTKIVPVEKVTVTVTDTTTDHPIRDTLRQEGADLTQTRPT